MRSSITSNYFHPYFNEIMSYFESFSALLINQRRLLSNSNTISKSMRVFFVGLYGDVFRNTFK